MRDKSGRKVETAVEARAGFLDRPVLVVLCASLALGVIVLGALWVCAYAEELLWDRAVWHERSSLFGGGEDLSALHAWIVPLLAVPQVTHYVLDGFLWRRGKNPRVKAALDL